MIDEIVDGHLRKKRNEFVARLQQKEAAICALASSHHPAGERCAVFGQKGGSYNYCFFVQFDPSGARWAVRVPVVPRLTCVEEKLEAEIAVMRYLASKTTIPVPALHAYSLRRDNLIGLPYMVMDYKEGQTLHDIGIQTLSDQHKTHLLDQIADVFLQLRKQEFPCIGSLSLETLEVTGRPLSIEANGQDTEGLDASSIWRPARVYDSAHEYYRSVVNLAMNDFTKARYAVYDKRDAAEMLYHLAGFRDYLPSWCDPRLDKGPFVMMHGDLRPANLLVHPETLDLVAVLDWEWSGVVPLQMFTPPTWLTGRDLGPLCVSEAGWYDTYLVALDSFLDRVALREAAARSAGVDDVPPLSEEWRHASAECRFLVGAALNNPPSISTVYAFIERRVLRSGENLPMRVAKFLEGDASRRALVRRKAYQTRVYKTELWLRNHFTRLGVAVGVMLGLSLVVCYQRFLRA